MGALIVPQSGTVYVDASSVIYAVEKTDPYAAVLQPIWLAAQRGQISIATSDLTWLETLTKPLRDGNALLEQLFRSFLSAREVTLVPANLNTWEHAAHLRGHGLKTPDALHAATALEVQSILFITNDAGFRRVPGLPIALLSEHVSP